MQVTYKIAVNFGLQAALGRCTCKSLVLCGYAQGFASMPL